MQHKKNISKCHKPNPNISLPSCVAMATTWQPLLLLYLITMALLVRCLLGHLLTKLVYRPHPLNGIVSNLHYFFLCGEFSKDSLYIVIKTVNRRLHILFSADLCSFFGIINHGRLLCWSLGIKKIKILKWGEIWDL